MQAIGALLPPRTLALFVELSGSLAYFTISLVAPEKAEWRIEGS